MIFFGFEQSSKYNNSLNKALDETDKYAEANPDIGLDNDDVFESLRKYINESR